MIAFRGSDVGIVSLTFDMKINQHIVKYSDGHVQYIDSPRGDKVIKLLRLMTKQSLRRVTQIKLPEE